MVALLGSAVAGLSVLGFSLKFYSCKPTKSHTPTSRCIFPPFVNTATLLLFSYLLPPVVLSIPLVWGKQYVSVCLHFVMDLYVVVTMIKFFFCQSMKVPHHFPILLSSLLMTPSLLSTLYLLSEGHPLMILIKSLIPISDSPLSISCTFVFCKAGSSNQLTKKALSN